MGNKISGSFTRKKLTPEEEAKQKAIEEGRQQHINEQTVFDAKNAKNRLRRKQSGLIPAFTAGVKTKFSNMGKTVKTGVSNMGQAVKTGVSNMGKTVKTGVSNMGQSVKTGVSNMGQSVKTGFNSARQKFSKKNSANDSERLLSESDNTQKTQQKNSWRERLVNMKQGASDKFGSLKKTVTNAKDAAVARFTRKNRSTESEKTRLLSDHNEIEMMENVKPLNVSDSSAVQSSNSQQTITSPPRQPTTPPLTPRQPPPPLPPPRQPTTPPSNSQLSSDFDDDKIDDSRQLESIKKLKINTLNKTTKTTDLLPLITGPPTAQPRIRSRSPSETPQAAGGNKTRKNRQQQYMREIKDNRTHLFNKEMEILNSIRNFKNGHIDNDNTKKQFMKAVKRG
jgi:hypothetical protein